MFASLSSFGVLSCQSKCVLCGGEPHPRTKLASVLPVELSACVGGGGVYAPSLHTLNLSIAPATTRHATTLTHTKLTHTKLTHTTLTHITLKRTTLTHTTLTHTTLKHATLTHTTLIHTTQHYTSGTLTQPFLVC